MQGASSLGTSTQVVEMREDAAAAVIVSGRGERGLASGNCERGGQESVVKSNEAATPVR